MLQLHEVCVSKVKKIKYLLNSKFNVDDLKDDKVNMYLYPIKKTIEYQVFIPEKENIEEHLETLFKSLFPSILKAIFIFLRLQSNPA